MPKVLLLSALMLALVAGERALATAAGSQRYVLTVSGGVSLGAYEGGFLYYLMNHLNNRTPRGELAVVTGASAGSLNSLMSILTTCGFSKDDPHTSLLYRVWQSVGIETLANPTDVTATSLFSQRAFGPAIAMIREAWMAGLQEGCDVHLGVSVTRRIPVQHKVRPGLVVVRQNEQFIFRIQGQGAGKPPRIHNAIIGNSTDLPLALPFTSEPSHDFDLLISALQASGAFPLAFAPQPLSICDMSEDPAATCSAAKATSAEFIDGGIFDNTPLRLADRIARHLYPREGDYNKLLFGIVSAGDETHPDPPSEDGAEGRHPQKGLFSYVNELALSLVHTTRSHEISSLLSEQPVMQERLLVNLRILPPAGSYFYAFSGFVDGGFRTFDFGLGMWEAAFFVQRGAHQQIASLGALPPPASAFYPSWASPPRGAPWEVYHCLSRAIERGQPAALSCPASGPNSTWFFPLVDTTLDLVRHRCRSNPAKAANFQSCSMLKQGPIAIKPGSDEADRDYFFRAMAARGYRYDNPSGSGGKLWLRTVLQPVMRRWAELQPAGEQAFVASGSHMMLDTLSYTPPREITYALIGTAISFGKSYALLTSGPLSTLNMERWEIGAMVQGLTNYLGRSRDRLAVTPYAGLAVDLTPLTNTSLRPRAGLRAGYQAANGDGFGARGCDEDLAKDLSYACTQATLHPYLSISILDRLRFDVVYQLFFLHRPSHAGEISLMIGLQDLTY